MMSSSLDQRKEGRGKASNPPSTENTLNQAWSPKKLADDEMSSRYKPRPGKEHWGHDIADAVVQRFPDRDLYTCAAGISPSGIVHFGNFRDLVTSLVVTRALEQAGHKAQLLFSWDDYDRFRKVPEGVPDSFKEFIGLPLSEVPDPLGKDESYARRFERPFEETLERLGINVKYVRQSDEYKAGRYAEQIIYALKHREEIADTLLSFMSEKGKNQKGINEDSYRQNFYPITVYSEFSGKDSTTVLSFDGQSRITYSCNDSGETSEVDINETGRIKLAWKIDWPMRWGVEGVAFEPGGTDHASPGGSFDVASTIARNVFGIDPPLFTGYDFIGLRGLKGKMSGSSGLSVSPAQLLDIYEPEVLLWLYTRIPPNQEFTLAFDSEIFRQYDERDREVARNAADKLKKPARQALEFSEYGIDDIPGGKPIPFRQAVALGQIVQWNPDKVVELSEALDFGFDPDSIKRRIQCARNWLEQYNPENAVVLRTSQNTEYISEMSVESKKQVQLLRDSLIEQSEISVKELEDLVYRIPKDPTLSKDENKPRQRAFFKDVYQLLLGSETGPRLPTFLWALNREDVTSLLDV